MAGSPRVAWLVTFAFWTTFSNTCCAGAAVRARPIAALPRVRSARASPLLLAVTEPSFDKPKLDREFFTIAAPAFIQFAAEPLARLVDAYYMGRLGAVALGGAGAAIAAQYAVAKLCNDPLLRSTISLVAAGDGSTRDAVGGEGEAPAVRAEPVATALLLALVVGVVQGLLFAFATGSMLTGMRVGPTSPMRAEACAYLRVCAFGAPAATLWLVLNGIFRGLGDTRSASVPTRILARTSTCTHAPAGLGPLSRPELGLCPAPGRRCSGHSSSPHSTRCSTPSSSSSAASAPRVRRRAPHSRKRCHALPSRPLPNVPP